MVLMNESVAARTAANPQAVDRPRTRQSRTLTAGRNGRSVTNGPLPGASMPAGSAAAFVSRQLQPSGE